MPRFKNRSQQEIYETCRRLAADVTSEFYVQGKPRSGAAHRNAYWNGRKGQPYASHRSSLAYAAWAAGRDDQKHIDKISAAVSA